MGCRHTILAGISMILSAIVYKHVKPRVWSNMLKSLFNKVNNRCWNIIFLVKSFKLNQNSKSDDLLCTVTWVLPEYVSTRHWFAMQKERRFHDNSSLWYVVLHSRIIDRAIIKLIIIIFVQLICKPQPFSRVIVYARPLARQVANSGLVL